MSATHARRATAVVAVCLLGLAPSVGGTAAAAAAGTAPVTGYTVDPDDWRGLARAAAKNDRYFGTATDNPELADDRYVDVLTSGEFSSLTPGNTMKWQYTERTRGTFDFTQADALVDLAQENGMMVRGHTLVWHSQLASWVQQLPADEVEDAMVDHVTALARHFAGDVYAWDVVNEPFTEDGTLRTSPFSTAMGVDYIATALRAAHAADPDAKLYLNDYNIEGLNAKSDAMYALAQDLLADGVPLDGIGVQGHLATRYGAPWAVQANLQRFADLGLDVAVTELDVRMDLPATDASLAKQVTYYTDVVDACLAVDRCVGVTIWDFTDKYSWVPSTFPGQGDALLWDEDLHRKHDLYREVRHALRA